MLVGFKRIRLLSAELLSYVDICHYYCNYYYWQTEPSMQSSHHLGRTSMKEDTQRKENKTWWKLNISWTEKKLSLFWNIFAYFYIVAYSYIPLCLRIFSVLSYFGKESMYFSLFSGKCVFLCSHICVFVYALVFVYFCFQLAAGREETGTGVQWSVCYICKCKCLSVSLCS